MSLGPLMVDLAGFELDAGDREVLRHPLVGGVILFARNYTGPQQLAALVAAIHAVRTPALLVAVDHEGGRVQRFREGFTALPPARLYGQVHDRDADAALQLTESCAWLLAAELRAVGVDLAFAPVVDLDYGASSVIGDRALHHDPQVVAALARAWLLGMRRAGMAATAKHFPGHGAVQGDSHHMLPVDGRAVSEIRHRDLPPYERLLRLDLPSVMMAHVVYEQVDALPASLSPRWIESELRGALGFQGAVFCDDLSMRGAALVGGYPERAQAALRAGCDMLPVCNNRAGVLEILQNPPQGINALSPWRLTRLHGRGGEAWPVLRASAAWRGARAALERYYPGGEFRLET